MKIYGPPRLTSRGSLKIHFLIFDCENEPREIGTQKGGDSNLGSNLFSAKLSHVKFLRITGLKKDHRAEKTLEGLIH